jgi:hypothetical protein
MDRCCEVTAAQATFCLLCPTMSFSYLIQSRVGYKVSARGERFWLFPLFTAFTPASSTDLVRVSSRGGPAAGGTLVCLRSRDRPAVLLILKVHMDLVCIDRKLSVSSDSPPSLCPLLVLQQGGFRRNESHSYSSHNRHAQDNRYEHNDVYLFHIQHGQLKW